MIDRAVILINVLQSLYSGDYQQKFLQMFYTLFTWWKGHDIIITYLHHYEVDITHGITFI